ncbi:MAG: methyl-accepting chemotaxis protein, partial [Planctomycetota bacterium]|nr:methyl-accepting chemotaxis protein [Planctomycetota bacterium]
YAQIVMHSTLLADILPPPLSLQATLPDLHQLAADPSRTAESLAKYESWRKEYAARREYWKAAPLGADDAQNLEKALVHVDRFNEAMDKVYIPQLQASKAEEFKKALASGELHNEFMQSIDLIVSVSKDIAEEITNRESAATSHAMNARNQIVMFIGALAAAVLVINILIGRSITRPLTTMLGKIRDMATGTRDLTQRLDTTGRDELTEVSTAFNGFVEQLVSSQEDSRRQSNQIELQATELKSKAVELVKATNAMAQGDFTVEIGVLGGDAMGEIGEGLSLAVDQIGQLIREATAATTRVDNGTTQIASASQSLAASASEQAASLEEISASLEEMSGMTRQNADNAQQAAALSSSATDSANRGKTETLQLGGAMKEIQESATKISQIIKTIDEIAFQTNLLALNAAVEAARAGEAGKGFAVVAEEVRNLAQRSADAAKSTASMIEEARKRADNGAAIGSRVGTALDEICGGAAKVSTLLSEIAASSREQATGISQITKGVSELDKVTQQNAGNSEELAAAAQESSSQMAGLTSTLSRFHVNGEPSGDHTAMATLPATAHKRPSHPVTRASHAANKTAGTTAAAAKNAIPFGEHEE